MKFLLKKFFSFIATIFIVSLTIFFIFNVLPGNPAHAILGIDADNQQIKLFEEDLGLDKPLHLRYIDWITGVAQGDLGESYKYRQPVEDVMQDRIPVSFSLAIIALLLTVVIGVPLGILIARTDGKWYSTVLSMITQLGISTPSFWLGFILILIFAVKLGLFPTYGFVPWSESFFGALRSYFLPALAIAISNIAIVIRYLRNSILDQSKQDYVRTAKVKGLGTSEIMYGHVLKNAFLPVLTILGLITADTLGGSIIIENVFALPGLGNLLVASIESRDFPLIQSLILIISLIIIVANFIVDLLYRVIDPRIRI
ncbi:Glutathione transport system permease protein GsiC [Paraliobacillus sp. PM-2]|uniref:ABC transporter permease n=1 Tax=Paraliobacillus sp. PM-2 TaxID=1462524 RepID=UPI00061C784C|nr:ABC transporter permease [Paraliobacillus sp. PM-2]CQR46816.1 Glutathione transport system permease protein GsiC [Paraliobacillus sp. PM-2]